MTASQLDPAPAVGAITRVPLLAPLSIRDFRLVWFGESISYLGDQFQIVALSWLVLGLTGSGFALGMILIAAAIPRGTFLLLGGALSDRVAPRDLALVSNILRAVVTVIVAGLVLGGRIEIWQLAGAGIVFGTVDAVFLPAINTLVPRLVPVDRLASANAALQGMIQLVGTIGPAVAGLAIAVIGIGGAIVVDAISFALAAYALWFVRGGSRPALPESPVTDELPRGSLWAAMSDGARSILGDPIIRATVILLTAANLAFTGPVVVGIPWLVLIRAGGDAAALGLLMASFGAGMFGGVVLAGSVRRPRRIRHSVAQPAAGHGHRTGGHRSRTVDPGDSRHPDRDRADERICQRRVHLVDPGPDGTASARPDDEPPDARVGRRGALVTRSRGDPGRPSRDRHVPGCRCARRRRSPRGPDQWPAGSDERRLTVVPAYHEPMTSPDSLPFTGDPVADHLLAADPFALLMGFALDQQVTVQKAFSGPRDLQQRLGHLDAARIAGMDPADLDAVFRERPAIHRFPGAMAGKIQALAAVIAAEYGNDAARVWEEATDGRDLEARLLGLPGIGEMKAKSLIAVLGKQFGVRPPGYEGVAPTWPTLGDVDSPEALATYQAAKRAKKAADRAAKG